MSARVDDNLLCEETMLDEQQLTMPGSSTTNNSSSGGKRSTNDCAGSSSKKTRVAHHQQQQQTPEAANLEILQQVQSMTIPELEKYCSKEMHLRICTDLSDCLQMIQAMCPDSDHTQVYPLWTMVFMLCLVCRDYMNSITPAPLLTTRTLTIVKLEDQLTAIDLHHLFPPLIAYTIQLKRSMKTGWANLQLRSLVNTSVENTGTYIELPCLMDLREFWHVCNNCAKILADIPLPIGSSFLRTKNTSTLSTYVNTATAAAGADGSTNLPSTSAASLTADTAGLFELPGLMPGTGDPSLATYLTTRGASKKLAASVKMKDYIIDLNIYRLVLVNRIMYLCEEFLKDKDRHMTFIRPLTYKRKNVYRSKYHVACTPLHYFFSDIKSGWYQSLHKAEETIKLYVLNKHTLMRRLLNTYDEWNPLWNNYDECELCTFRHPLFSCENIPFDEFIENYPFLNNITIDYVYTNCFLPGNIYVD